MLLIKKVLYILTACSLVIPATGYSRQITVVSDDNYPPYIFRDSSGKLQGIIVDQWELWKTRTGIDVRIDAMDWGRAKEMMARGNADVIDTIFYTSSRALLYDFTPPYADLDVPVFFEESISGISSIESLKGYVVGVKSGDACIDVLRARGITALKEYPSYEAIIRDAAAGGVHVFCADKPPALFYIYRYGIENKFRYSLSLGKGQFHRAVHKGNSQLLDLVNRGFSQISSEEYAAIDEKWFGSSIGIKSSWLFRNILIILYIAASAALTLILFNIYLRRRIKQKTTELAEAFSRLEASESKNRALIAANPDMLFIFNSNGDFIDFKSPETSPLYRPSHEFIGKNARDVLPPEIAGLTIQNIERVLETGENQFFEYSLFINNSMMYFDSRLVSMGEDRILAIVRDISDKKIREEESLRTHKLESLGIFAGGIAHDFNNILTAIVGNISLARLKIDDRKRAYHLLDEAEKAGLRARKLTDQLLAFARGGNPVKEITGIEDVVREYANFAMSGSKSAIRYSVANNLKSVNIDRGQIGQVIQNIILNASQSMPAGGTIDVSIQDSDIHGDNPLDLPEGPYITVSIRDEGCGIKPENLKTVFDPYFTTRPEGSGLGLTICHTIIKRHGGAIHVESMPDYGTTFIIYIPAYTGDASSPEIPEEISGNFDLRDCCVLVMDDEPQLRDMMAEVLLEAEVKVHLAKDGNEALAMYDKCSSDSSPVKILIADLTIPGSMGGRELVSILRQKDAKFKAVVISGYSSDPVISEYKKYGFNAYLVKPFSATDLLDTVKKLANPGYQD